MEVNEHHRHKRIFAARRLSTVMTEFKRGMSSFNEAMVVAARSFNALSAELRRLPTPLRFAITGTEHRRPKRPSRGQRRHVRRQKAAAR